MDENPLFRTFLFTVSFYVAALFFTSLLAVVDLKTGKSESEEKPTTAEKFTLATFKEIPSFAWLIILNLTIFYAAVVPFICISTSFFQNYFDFEKSKASIFCSAFYMIAVPLSPLFGYLADKYGFHCVWTLVSLTIGSFSAAYCALGYSYGAEILVIGIGITYAVANTILSPLLTVLVEPKYQALLYGLLYAVANVSMSASSKAYGVLRDSEKLKDNYRDQFIINALIVGLIISTLTNAVLVSRIGWNPSKKKRDETLEDNIKEEIENLKIVESTKTDNFTTGRHRIDTMPAIEEKNPLISEPNSLESK